MNEQTDSLNQHHVLAAVRALLQTVQEPLAPLAEALQAPDQLWADLTPALDVVAFSPFAELTVSTPEAQQPAAKPPLRATGVPPVATATGALANQSALPLAALPSQPRLAPPAASANTLRYTPVTLVFALPSQKRAATVADSLAAQAVASTAQPGTYPATPSPIAMTADTMTKAEHSAPRLDSGQSMSLVRPNALPIDPVADNHTMASTPPLATMTLLATVADSLLAVTPSARLEPAAHQAPGMAGSAPIPTPSLLPANGSLQWPVDHEPALHRPFAPGQPIAAPASPSSLPLPSNTPMAAFSSLLPEWPAARGDNQPTDQPTTQPPNHPTPDPWTLAQLINDVLAEEARRHGVDLS